jgi:E3 ubiquitin-protein ligase BRE1
MFYVWIQLMSESLQAKQLQTSLQAEKQVLNARMQHANAASDLHKQRIARLEEQVRTFCTDFVVGYF